MIARLTIATLFTAALATPLMANDGFGGGAGGQGDGGAGGGHDRPDIAIPDRLGLRVVPIPVQTRFLPDGGFQAVACWRFEALGDEDVAIGSAWFQDHNQSVLEWVDEVALGMDANGDGHWTADADLLLPGVPDVGPGVLAEDHDNGFVTRFYKIAVGGQTGMWGPRWWGHGNTMFTARPGAPAVVFMLYRFMPDTPLDTVFIPAVPTNAFVDSGWKDAAGVIFEPFINDEPAIEFAWDGLSAEAVEPAVAQVTGGETDRLLAQIRLIAPDAGDAQTVHSVDLSLASGDPHDIANVRVYDDADNSGSLTDSDVLLVSEPMGFRPGVLHVVATAMADIPAGASHDIFVVVDFAEHLPQGMDYAVRLDALDSGPVTPIGLPLTCPPLVGNVTRDPEVAVSVAQPASPDADDGRVVAALLRIDAFDGDVVVSRLRLQPAGTADPGRATSRLQLIVDRNSNGHLDAADTWLAEGAFTSPDTLLDLTPNAPVSSGTRLQLLMVWTLTDEAEGGTLGVRVLEAGLVPADVPIRGLPLQSPLIELGGRAERDDREFDTVTPPGPIGAVAGCAAGSGRGLLPMAAGVLLVVVSALRRRT